jgi:hypothetical protein
MAEISPLRRRMVEDMKICNLRILTEDSYIVTYADRWTFAPQRIVPLVEGHNACGSAGAWIAAS